MRHPLATWSKQQKFWVPENWRPGLSVDEDTWFKQNQKMLLWIANTEYGRDMLGIPKAYGKIISFAKNRVTFRVDSKTKVSDFRIGAKYANVIRYRWQPFMDMVKYYHEQSILKGFFAPVPAWSFGLTTSTFYPDPNPETTSVDGSVGRTGVDETWATIRDNANANNTDDSSANAGNYVVGSATTNQWSNLIRCVFLFDTASIPDTDTIDSATFSLQATSAPNNLGGGHSHYLIQMNPASNTALVAGDYDSFTMTAQAAAFALASWSTTAYNDFTLNATGLTNISKTGVSKFGTTGDSDFNNSPPTWVNGEAHGLDGVKMADTAGTTSDPKLVVVHSAAGGGNSLFALMGVG